MRDLLANQSATRRRLTKSATALLLVIQALGGGAVTLAHASDRSTAPVTIEARHDARCVVLHDALRCALCHYAGVSVTVPQTAQRAPVDVVVERPQGAAAVLPARSSEHLSAPPRAPPVFHS